MSVGEGGKSPGQVVADSYHGDGFSGNQVKAPRGGDRVALILRIRSNHGLYLSLGINHTLRFQDLLCWALLAVL